jgi:hypothetical protein
MAKKKKTKKIKNPPLWIVILMIISMIGGIIVSVIGISRIENYYHPYLFGFIFGVVGLLVGYLVSQKARPIIAVNHKIKNNYGMAIMYISVGFIGLFLLIGTYINQNLSKVDKFSNCLVVNKYRQESRFRTPEINSLVVNLNGQTKRLVCSREFWYKTNVGQRINLCFYESSIGFNYIEIVDDK